MKLQPIDGFSDPDRNRMRNEQKRDREAEQELPRLARRHAQMSPPIQGVEPEQTVDQQSAIKNGETDSGLPRLEQDDSCRFHGLDRADSECVIDEMACHIGEQDQSGYGAKSPLALRREAHGLLERF